MRKRRRLADKLSIMVCAVLVAVSAFFYAPMDVDAQIVSDVYYQNSKFGNSRVKDPDVFYIKDFLPGVNSGFYRVRLNFTVNLSSDVPVIYRNFFFCINALGQFQQMSLGSTSFVDEYTFTESRMFYIDASRPRDESEVTCYYVSNSLVDDSVSHVSFDFDYDFQFIDSRLISEDDYLTYQNGYNDGYSAGEQVGESNGYSNGYSDGFEAGEQSGYDSGFQSGQDSVDTQSYYDMGYSAGYDVGYQSGYDEGYEEGYSKALKSVQGSSGQWGSPMFVGTPTEIKRYGQGFYVSSYGLVDMEEYQSGVNGYFYNTVPGTYDGYTTISYNIPFYSFNNGLVKIDSDKFQVDFGLRDLDISVECDDGNGTELANLMESRLNEVYVVYNGRKYYGNYDIGTGYVEFDFIAEGVGNPTYLNTGSMTLVFNIHNTVTLVTDADVSHFISAKYHNVLQCSLGIPSNSYAIYIRPYLENDRVSANIQDQTNSLINGFNDSKGNSVNNDFSSGLNDFETAEDSLFATATTGLKDFAFFDFQSVPAMVTGMSFVGSIMSGWFTQAGGASGVGIVLSILFSIMLVAMVLGLYRWYQSKGGKD